MAGVPADLPAGVRAGDHISPGVIAKTLPSGLAHISDSVRRKMSGYKLRPRTPQPIAWIDVPAIWIEK